MPKILQLSVLDPAIHTRIFFKIALSLSDAGFEVIVVGTDKAPIPIQLPDNLKVIALPTIPRSFTKRLNRGFELLQIAFQHRPDAVMIHNPELLHIALLYKLFFPKTQLFYDVLEDYQKNFLFHPFMKGWKKNLIASVIRFLEKAALPFFEGVFYAEKCYDNILNVPLKKKHILLNRFTQKALLPAVFPRIDEPYMLCCGTLNRTWGVQKTLELWQEFNKISPLHLVIVGFTYDDFTLPMIHDFVAKSPYKSRFSLIGGDKYVPYPLILQLIQHCAFGTGLYNLPPNIQGKIPTKFYEFLALKKPLLFTSDPFWNELNDEWNLGIPVTPNDSPEHIWEKLETFSHKNLPNEVYSWEENEESVLVDVIRKGFA